MITGCAHRRIRATACSKKHLMNGKMFQFLVLTEQDDIWGQYIVIKSVVFEKNKTIIYIYIYIYLSLHRAPL